MATYDNIVTDGLVFQVDAANKQTLQATGVGKDISSMVNVSEEGEYINSVPINDNSWDFDGVSDYIDFGDIYNFSIGTSFSVSSWVYKLGSYQGVIVTKGPAFNRGWHLRQNGNGYRFILVQTPNIVTFSDVTSASVGWHNVVGVYDGSADETSIYLDGVFIGGSNKLNGGALDISTTDSLVIGINKQTSSLAYQDKIAQISIYDKVLTGEEVKKNYEATKHRFE